MSRPPEALQAAESILRRRPDPLAKSYAQQARGIVLRETGKLGPASRAMAAAVANARRTGDSARTADTLATAGTVHARAGRVGEALAAFDEALATAPVIMRGPVLIRRGTALQTFDRYGEAEGDYREAAAILSASDEPLWLARALSNLGFLLSDLGRAGEAEHVLAEAEPLHLKVGQDYEAALVRHNLAWCAYRRGDLPTALRHLAIASDRYATSGTEPSSVQADRCAVMLAAGLAADALASARAAHELMLRSRDSSPVSQATTLLSVANAALAAGDRDAAESAARASRKMFSRGHSDIGTALADLALLQSRAPAAGRLSVLRCQSIAETLESRGRNEALAAHLLGGIAGSRVRSRATREQARAELTKAAQGRQSGNALDRALGWQAVAVSAAMDGDATAVFNACEAGLIVLDEHRLSLGATEMRAAATAHGAELAELGLRYAHRVGDPLLMLAWSERWRATALSVAPVRPPDDKQLAEDLAGLRELTRQITEARQEGLSTDDLEVQRTHLEEAARHRTLRTRGNGSGTPVRYEPAQLQRALGRTRLVELVAIDGRLHILVLDRRGAAHFPGASLAEAAREVDLIRFALHRTSRPNSGGAPSKQRTAATLAAAAEQLQQVLLGEAIAALGADGTPLIVIPPGRLHAVPWGVLPAMRSRAVTVAPSAAVWLRGRRARGPRSRNVVLVHGPDLRTGGAEVSPLESEYPGAVVLGGGGARTSDVLQAMNGAWLAHVAAHGSFRSDNPMFSALHVDDGPLTVHDLGRLRRAPYRVVLSACESGLGAAAGSDELLGLASALVPLGTAGLVASVVPVNDEATVPLMLTLHEQVRAGSTLAEGLRVARQQAGDEPVAMATAAAFVALGAA